MLRGCCMHAIKISEYLWLMCCASELTARDIALAANGGPSSAKGGRRVLPPKSQGNKQGDIGEYHSERHLLLLPLHSFKSF
jgi:hypothetical protein